MTAPYYTGKMIILSYYGERDRYEAHSRILVRSGYGHFTMIVDSDMPSLAFAGRLWDMFSSYGRCEVHITD